MKNFKYIIALLVLCFSAEVFAGQSVAYVTHPLDMVNPNPMVGNIVFGQQVQCNNGGTYNTDATGVSAAQCGCDTIKQSDNMLWDGAVAADNADIDPVAAGGDCNAVQHRIYPLEVAISDVESRACWDTTWAYTISKNSQYWCKKKLTEVSHTESADDGWQCNKNPSICGDCESTGTCTRYFPVCDKYCEENCKGTDANVYAEWRKKGYPGTDVKQQCWDEDDYSTVTWHAVCSEAAAANPKDTPTLGGDRATLSFEVENVMGAEGEYELVLNDLAPSTLSAPTEGAEGNLLKSNTEDRWDYYCYDGDDIYEGPTAPQTCKVGELTNQPCYAKVYGPYAGREDCSSSTTSLVRHQRYFLQRAGCDYASGSGCDIPLGPYKIAVTVKGLHGTTAAGAGKPIPLNDTDTSTTTWFDRATDGEGVNLIPGPESGVVDVCDYNGNASLNGCPHEAICSKLKPIINSTLSYTGGLPSGIVMEGRIAEVKTSGETIKEQVYFIRGVAAEISRPDGAVAGGVVENYDKDESDYAQVYPANKPGVIVEGTNFNNNERKIVGVYGELDTSSGGYIRFGGSDNEPDGTQTIDLLAIGDPNSIYVSSLRSLKKGDAATDVMPISPYSEGNAGRTAAQMKSLAETVNIFTDVANVGGTEGLAWCSGVSQAVNVLMDQANGGCDEDDDKCVLFIAVAIPPGSADESEHQLQVPARWGSNYNAGNGQPDTHLNDSIDVSYPAGGVDTVSRPKFYECVTTAVNRLKAAKGKVIVVGLNPAGDTDFINWVKATSTDSSIESATGVHAMFIGDVDPSNPLEGTAADIAAETLWAIMPKPIEICQGPGGCPGQ